jgi:hypothetical protein
VASAQQTPQAAGMAVVMPLELHMALQVEVDLIFAQLLGIGILE